MSDENTKVLTPEQEEELKFKSKYPGSQKPGGSAFIQKMLHRGHKKYFDSGDYNMAKSKNKLLSTPAASIPPTIVSPSTPNPNNNSLSSTNSQTPSTPSSIKQQPPQNLSLNNSTNTNLNTSSCSSNNSNSTTNNTNNNNINNSINNNNNNNNYSNINIDVTKSSCDSSPLSNFSSPVVPNPHHNLNNLTNSQFIINDNLLTDNLLINDDIIGHEIPTPECLPRKHSNIQSKLATTSEPSEDSN